MRKLVKKHKILEKIYHHKQTIPEHYKGGSFGMDKDMLNKALDFEVNKDLLVSMQLSGYLVLLEHGFTKGRYLYCITDLGDHLYLEEMLLNQVWYRSQEFWLRVTPIVVSLGALVVSILSFLYAHSHK